MKRADWHLRANVFVFIFLVFALISGVVNVVTNQGKISWLTVHLLLLGAVSNGIVTWSEHFVGALLWSRPQNRIRQMNIVLILNAGIVGVLLGIHQHWEALIVPSAIIVAAIVSIYLRGVSGFVSEALNRKFVGVIRYYQCAGVALLIGILLGVVDTFRSEGDSWQPRLALAHLHVNLMGWVGMTMIGTLVTLWPTVLRTPMHPKALHASNIGLKFLVIGTTLVGTGSLIDYRTLYALGDLIYLIGIIVTLTPAIALMKKRTPDRSSSWMILIGIAGILLLPLIDSVIAITHSSPEKILQVIEGHIVVMFTLWLLPIFLGALMYLLPVVLGKGPKLNRELERNINFGWQWRVLLLPISSLLLFNPRYEKLGLAIAGAAIAIFLVLALTTMWNSRRGRGVVVNS